MQKLSLSWLDVDIPVVCQQVLHRNLQNLTQEAACLLPFVPLKTLKELFTGEIILRNISSYANILWSPQQVRILYFYLHAVWSSILLKTDGALVCGEETVNSFSLHSHLSAACQLSFTWAFKDISTSYTSAAIRLISLDVLQWCGGVSHKWIIAEF